MIGFDVADARHVVCTALRVAMQRITMQHIAIHVEFA
jgi:hypothetical protein